MRRLRMTFKVDLSEVNSMADKIKATSNVLEKDLHNVTRQLDELIALDSFQGDTATHAKKYFESVHQTAIHSIQLIAHKLASNIEMHIDTFNEDVDTSVTAKIEYNYLQDVKENIQTHHEDIEDSVQNVAHTIDEISDIITIDHPPLSDIQTSKDNADQTVDQLTNNVELFTEKGTDQDVEMKEMLHHLETLIAEASTNTGESNFSNVQPSSIAEPISFLDEANQLLEYQQAEEQKEVLVEKSQETFGKMSDMMETSTLNVKYEKKPSTIVDFSQSLLEGFKGGGKAIYQLIEEAIQMIVDFPATFKALQSMIAHPIDTAKYIGHAITDSFNRDVINGDAESRGKWFTYAVVSVIGFKGVSKVGKLGTEAAKKGAEKTVQRLDELLPYHPKHQLAIDGPVPYNVYDGINLRDQLMVKVENSFRKEKGLMSGDKMSGKGTDDVAKKASVVDNIFKEGKKVVDNFNIDDAYVKPKHLSTTKGNGAKFLGDSKVAAEHILMDSMKNGTVQLITDNGLTKMGKQSYSVIIDAGKNIGTKGENLIKVVLSEDGGMLSAYPIK